MREFIRERKSNIDFSLHDSRIKKIFLEGNTLVFEIDTIYQYKEEVEHGYKAEIIFCDCLLEECNALIFNKTLMHGKFSGQYMTLKDFIKQYDNQEFEILTESYCGGCTIYSGWLWKNHGPVSAQLELRNSGDLIYRIGRQVF